MSVPSRGSQFVWFSMWNRFQANGVASPFQREGEGEGFLQAPKTPHLSPLPLPNGRGEKGRRLSFSFSALTINGVSHS
jgi:hypothetical protein